VRFNVLPTHTGPLFPTVTTREGLIVTTTLLLLVHPEAVLVTITVYVVVTKGDTVGSAAVEVNPVGTELQLYVLPATGEAPRVVLAVRQIALLAPATAAGSELTVIAMVRGSLVPHPLVVVTDNIPLVATRLKSMVTEFPDPLIV
jgi:hypothetical protein